MYIHVILIVIVIVTVTNSTDYNNKHNETTTNNRAPHATLTRPRSTICSSTPSMASGATTHYGML